MLQNNFITVNVTPALALRQPKSHDKAHLSSSSLCMKPFTVSVTLKPPNSQSFACRPQCDVDAGDGLFFGCCSLAVGLDTIGDTAGSEVVRFGCGGAEIECVMICVVLGNEFGGEGRPVGDLDLDRERGWKMESFVVEREMDLVLNGKGKE